MHDFNPSLPTDQLAKFKDSPHGRTLLVRHDSRAAQCATTSLSIGTHSLTAVYSGDATNVVTGITWASWTATGATGVDERVDDQPEGEKATVKKSEPAPATAVVASAHARKAKQRIG